MIVRLFDVPPGTLFTSEYAPGGVFEMQSVAINSETLAIVHCMAIRRYTVENGVLVRSDDVKPSRWNHHARVRTVKLTIVEF